MNIIWLCPEMIYPGNTGGRLGCLKRIEYMSKMNKIFLYCIIDSKEDLAGKSYLDSICEEVHLYNRMDYILKSLLKSLFYPFAFASRCSSQMKSDINSCFKKNQIDYVIVDFPQMMGNISNEIINSGKVILNQHNIEDRTMRNLANSMRFSLKKFAFLLDSYRLGFIESKIYRKNISLYTFVSTEDKVYFERKYNKINTYHLPVCCEIHSYQALLPKASRIMMIGKMSYPANAEAAIWFASNVFPRVCNSVDDAQFYIVGKDPTIEVLNLAQNNNNVIVTGTVDDVSSYYKDATLIVIPLMHGGGVKVKLLEALGYGKLVVSTTKGIEGTYLRGDEHLLIADTDQNMANVCIDALNNISKYENIRRRGYEYVKNHHSFEEVINRFNNYLKTK